MKASKIEGGLSFVVGVKLLVDFFNDPTTLLTRWQGIADYKIEDEETAVLKRGRNAS